MHDDSLSVWRRADAVLDQLLDLPPQQRGKRLAELDLPADVRDCVQRLLEAHEAQHGPLDRPLLAEAGEVLRGRQLGIWTLQEEIGRGGMAVVYRATALLQGSEREAALKLMTLGALVAGGLERFRAEQAILARLNHPHIAQLFDTGVAQDGTPWLAMALVHGIPVDAWCRTRRLDALQIARVFLGICEAVTHAHQNLVIHRDIKPSNVLVDADGHVRLLDFGIARLADESAPATQTLLRVLTPQYAAPEQIAGAPPSTAMDIYGLGALLYHLLTGQPPRAVAALGIAAPSRQPGAAATAPRRDDLDAIVLKALAEQPQARYAAVPALADDVRRWLQGEPVLAQRPTWTYRTRRFVSRHRWGVSAAAAFVIALLAGSSVIAWQAARVRAESTRAHTVQGFLVGLFEAASPASKDGGLLDARALLARGAQDARANLADGVLKAEMLLVIGAIQSRLGQLDAAQQQLDAAQQQATSSAAPRDLHGRIALELGLLAMSQMRRADSNRWLDQAINLLRENGEWREKLIEAYLFRASNFEVLGQLDAAFADQASAEAVEASLQPPSPRRRMNLLQNQARTLLSAGRLREADARLRTALALLDAPRGEDYATFVLAGDTAEDLGDWARAETNLRRGLAIARESYPAQSHFLSVPMTYLGNYLVRTGRLSEAAPLLREALELRRASSGLTTALAIPSLNVGSLERDLGNHAAALQLLAEARRLCKEDPIAELLIGAQIARTQAEAGDSDNARESVIATRARAEELQRGGAANPARFARAYTWLALAELQAAQAPGALQLLDLAEAAENSQAQAQSPTFLQRRAMRALAQLDAGQREAALAQETALAGAARLLPVELVAERAYTYAVLVRLALESGDTARARTYLAAARPQAADRQLPVYLALQLDGLEKLLTPRNPE